jgi:hypothetical protein
MISPQIFRVQADFEVDEFSRAILPPAAWIVIFRASVVFCLENTAKVITVIRTYQLVNLYIGDT